MAQQIKEKTEYSYCNDSGDAHIVVYHLFPGVEVADISVHMGDFDFSMVEKNRRQQSIAIHYCMEGRMEQEIDNEFFYLMPDDCYIVMQDPREKKFQFPLKHYHGISIGIHTDPAPQNFSLYMENKEIEPIRVAGRLCGEHPSVTLRSVEQIKHIFTESYAIPQQHKADYLKIKLLELLFVLSRLDLSQAMTKEYAVPRTQAELVKKVAGYISVNLNDKLSLKMLTAMFGVSDTYLQKSFRAIYGMPVASFIRMQKMQKAAQLLIHTDRSIEDIAEEFGYTNESKFSAAFKRLMGDSPSVFRKEHSKIIIKKIGSEKR